MVLTLFLPIAAGCDRGEEGGASDDRSKSREYEAPAFPSKKAADEPDTSREEETREDGQATADTRVSRDTAAAGGVTDRELREFARIQVELEEYSKEFEGEPDDRRAEIDRMLRTKRKIDALLAELTIDRRRYAEIGRALRENPSLRGRLQRQIRELRGGSPPDAG